MKKILTLLSCLIFLSLTTIAQQSNAVYKIILNASGLALDANEADGNNGKVRLMQNNGSNGQNWKIVNVGGNNYQITLGAFALDAAGETYSKNGGLVHLWQSNGKFTQIWKISPLGNGKYSITLNKNGKSLDADAAQIYQNNCTIQLWDYRANNIDQIWNLVPVPAIPVPVVLPPQPTQITDNPQVFDRRNNSQLPEGKYIL
jgi:hypothetical protein